VGSVLGELMDELGLSRKLREQNVLTSWEQVVGLQIARVAKPQKIENGVLVVSVASAAWRNELSIRRREIIGKINGKAGRAVVRDIRFR
jgi:predicted nucleic acid-binding Zn ribbon protein